MGGGRNLGGKVLGGLPATITSMVIIGLLRSHRGEKEGHHDLLLYL